MKVQETQRVPIKMNPKRPTPTHIIIKMPRIKDKERILKAAREKQEVTYKGALVRIAADLSTATLQARKERQKIFQVMKSKGLQPRLLYPARLSINGRPNKEFPRQKKTERIHLHQTRPTSTKGTTIRREGKGVKERNTGTKGGK